jgi:hypothetical protein
MSSVATPQHAPVCAQGCEVLQQAPANIQLIVGGHNRQVDGHNRHARIM